MRETCPNQFSLFKFSPSFNDLILGPDTLHLPSELLKIHQYGAVARRASSSNLMGPYVVLSLSKPQGRGCRSCIVHPSGHGACPIHYT